MVKFRLKVTARILKTLLLSALTIGLLASIYYQNWINALIVLGILILSMLPELFARQYSLALPAEFDLATVAFLFAALFLGELGNFYEHFWWWDELLHLTSGLLLGMFGLYLIWVLNHNDHIELELSPGFICLFAFAFALSVGTLWEIFEFTMDNLFSLNMQKNGLQDTMKDLMVDALGALVVSTGANIYLSTGRNSIMSHWIKRIIALHRHAISRKSK